MVTKSVRDDDNYVEVQTVNNGGNTKVQESSERNSCTFFMQSRGFPVTAFL